LRARTPNDMAAASTSSRTRSRNQGCSANGTGNTSSPSTSLPAPTRARCWPCCKGREVDEAGAFWEWADAMPFSTTRSRPHCRWSWREPIPEATSGRREPAEPSSTGDVRSQHAVAAETTSQPGGPAFRVAEADRLRGRTPSTCAFAVRIRKGAVRSRQGPAGGVCLWSRCKTSTGDLPDGAAGAQAETPTARAVGKVSRRIVGHERRRYNYSALLCV
jgi:hypothetical protein